MRLKPFLSVFLMPLLYQTCAAQDWPSLWKSYNAGFMDNQVRVMDHSAGDRTTSEGQAYGMFFALVANDRACFDGLLHWTEQNLAQGSLGEHLPAWLWGHGAGNSWHVLDTNSAADADLWMAYTLLEAGQAWKEPSYTKMGMALAHRIEAEEVVDVPGLGEMVEPGPTGFRHGDTYRLNASYAPVEVLLGLESFMPAGPWKKLAANVPTLIKDSASHGFAPDWTDLQMDGRMTVTPTIGSYDAIRVYLWAGMMDPTTPHREEVLKSLSGMENLLRTNPIPPAKVRPDGSIEDPKGPVGFSAALLPYVLALGDEQMGRQLMSHVEAELNPQTGLYGRPALYYDQNLVLFALGFEEGQYLFNSNGTLKLKWLMKE
jgi:endoglucanase